MDERTLWLLQLLTEPKMCCVKNGKRRRWDEPRWFNYDNGQWTVLYLYVQRKKITIKHAIVGSCPAPESYAIVLSEIAKFLFISPRPGDSKNIGDHRNLCLGEYYNRQSVSVSHSSIDEESVTLAHSSLTFNSSKIHLPRNQPSFVVCLCSPTQCTLSVGGFKRLIRKSYWLLALVVVCPGQKLSNSHERSLYSLSIPCFPCLIIYCV